MRILIAAAVAATLSLGLSSCHMTDKEASQLTHEGDGMAAPEGTFHDDDSFLEGATLVEEGDTVEARGEIHYFAACKRGHGGAGRWKSPAFKSRKTANSWARSHNKTFRGHSAKIYLTRK